MRISIWEQFSSNHSSAFTVIGIFKTAEDAAEAARALNAMSQAALEWMHLPENAKLRKRKANAGSIPPTPPEREFAEKIGVVWDMSRYGDMFVAGWSWPMVVFDNLLIIDGTESDYGAYPYDAVVVMMGGETYVHGVLRTEFIKAPLPGRKKPVTQINDIGHSKITVSVSCRASDEAAAVQIEDEYGDHQSRMRASREVNRPDFFSTRAGYGNRSSFANQLRREGAALYFDGLAFQHILDGFTMMIKYLRDKGCTDIHYEFTEQRDAD